jgi:hypothetical protein
VRASGVRRCLDDPLIGASFRRAAAYLASANAPGRLCIEPIKRPSLIRLDALRGFPLTTNRAGDGRKATRNAAPRVAPAINSTSILASRLLVEQIIVAQMSNTHHGVPLWRILPADRR